MTRAHRSLPTLPLAAALLLLALPAYPSGSTAWEMTSYADFIRGHFDGISLSRDGRLTLGPKIDTVFTSDQQVIWSVAEATDGSLYAGTGNRGRIYKIDRAGKSSLYWTAGEPEIFALAAAPDGAIYAGTSPNGKVYRIANGVAKEYFAPQSRYIWSMAVGPDGSLYVGTGDQGKVFRVAPGGKTSEVFYDTGQSHITGLAVDSQGRLLAGTEPNGILYRISAKDKAFVLYDANLPEIRAIVPMPDGTVYAAALGGSVAKQAQAAAQAAQANGAAVPAPGTVVTVAVDMQANPGAEIKPPDARLQPPAAAPAPQVTSSFTPMVDTSGIDKSALYRINPDNTVDTLWSSKEENVYDVLALEKQILFSTDQNGRIYGLSPDRRVTLVTQTNEGETVRLLPADRSILAATGNMGRIFRLGETAGSNGQYDAPVHDSGTASQWGSMSWRADLPAGCKIAFRTRAGNSAKPDRTWSEWSAPLTNPNGSQIGSPNARYIQWKVEMTGAGGVTPILDDVTLAYLPRNSPPVIRSVNIVSQAVATQARQTVSPANYSVTVTDGGDASSNSAGTATQTLPRAFMQQVTISWQADDPDGDRLAYTVDFRGEGEMQWKVLKTATHDTSLSFDASILADGKYYFRVIASDRESNPANTAREAILDSNPVMIDNTPPAVTMGAHSFANGAAHIEWEAVDATSALRHCEYSLDAGDWIPMQSVDGIIDSPREQFSLDLTNLKAGEHLLVVRASDSANNTGVAKVVLK